MSDTTIAPVGIAWNRDHLPPGPEQDAVIKGITGEMCGGKPCADKKAALASATN